MIWHEHWKVFDGYEQKFLTDPLIKQIRATADTQSLVGKVIIRQIGFLSDGDTERHGWTGKIRLCEFEKVDDQKTRLAIRINTEKSTEWTLISSDEPRDYMETKIEVVLSSDSCETKTLWRESTNLGVSYLKDKIRKLGEEIIEWPKGQYWERIYP